MTTNTVLVTGASTGIGRATALRLARDGWAVFAGVRKANDGDALESAADAEQRGGPGSLRAVNLDVTDDDGVAAVMDEIAEEVGVAGLRGLVNNAGIALGGPLEYLPLDVWRRQFDVNVIGQVAVTRAAMPLLRLHRGGARIVFTGSNSGRVSTPLMGPYSSSKFAVEGLADALRMELHGSGIDVIVVQPGAVKTPIWEKGRAQVAEMRTMLPPAAFDRYDTLISAVTKGLEDADSSGVPADQVAGVITSALSVKRPRTRYQVGIDAKVSVALARVLPTRVMDAAIRRVVRP